MIKHIIFFRLVNYASEEKKNHLEEMRNRFYELKSKIHEIRYLEVGINFNTRDVAYDICLYTHFDSKEDLNTYQIHPAHLELLDFLKTINREISVVDYSV